MNLSSFLQSGYTDQPFCLVMGDPVEHSLSPEIHNFASRHHNLDWSYYKVQVRHDELKEATQLFHLKTFVGANITIPHKQAIMPFLDMIKKSAQEAHAVNTIAVKAGILTGYNTDEYGFSQPLLRYADMLKHGSALIFGSGGASAAVIYALIHYFSVEKIYVVSRYEQAKISHSPTVSVIGYGSVGEVIGNVNIIVNATPMGMTGFPDESPLESGLLASVSGKICYDLIYRPLQTTFLADCTDNGGIAVNGLPMFMHQAAKAFELWTGKPFPVEEAETQLLNKLKSARSH
jgi:shikimate dehydrogenase